MAISEPRVSRQNGNLFCDEFQDGYFSKEDGTEESRYVFLDGNGMPQRWNEIPAHKKTTEFTILETGFGTGLNFVLTAATFLDSQKNGAKIRTLHYISLEKYPLKKSDLAESLQNSFQVSRVKLKSAHYARMIDSLAENYPLRVTGFHRIIFEECRINLTLIFADVKDAMAQIHVPQNDTTIRGNVDAFYLDGFNPATNNEMWTRENFDALYRLAAPGATLATFTAAGHVRRALQDAGFTVTKIPGYGRKREMITARVSIDKYKENSTRERNARDNDKPWLFGYSDIVNSENRKVAVIGAGVAGCALAEAFARRGWHVELIERNTEICGEASGNPLGIYFPVVHRRPTFTDRFSLAAYLYMLRHLKRLNDAGFGALIGGRQQGLLQILDEKEKADRFGDYLALHGSLDLFFEKDPEKFDFTGLSSIIKGKSGGIFYPQAGFLSPKGLSQANLSIVAGDGNMYAGVNSGGFTLKTSCHVTSLEFVDGRWRLKGFHGGQDSGQTRAFETRADVVVLANAGDIKNLPQTANLPLHRIRGQLVFSANRFEKVGAANEKYEAAALDLPYPISGSEYIIEGNGKVIIGATHDFSDQTQADPAQSASLLEQGLAMFNEADPVGKINRENMRKIFLKSMMARVSFRSAAVDHFPLIGPIADETRYYEIFADLVHGEAHYLRRHGGAGLDIGPRAWHRNLFCLAGLGSRGILYSHLGAEIVAAYACAEPLPVESDIAAALSPARFLYRDIRRQIASSATRR